MSAQLQDGAVENTHASTSTSPTVSQVTIPRTGNAAPGPIVASTPPRIIVFGSRSYPFLSLVRLRVNTIPQEAVVVVGGAAGPDKTAQNTAERRKMRVELHRANWSDLGKRAGHVRNALMASLGADLAICYWDGQSRGTAGMINECKRYGIPLEIWDADGTLTTAEDATLRLWRDRH